MHAHVTCAALGCTTPLFWGYAYLKPFQISYVRWISSFYAGNILRFWRILKNSRGGCIYHRYDTGMFFACMCSFCAFLSFCVCVCMHEYVCMPIHRWWFLCVCVLEILLTYNLSVCVYKSIHTHRLCDSSNSLCMDMYMMCMCMYVGIHTNTITYTHMCVYACVTYTFIHIHVHT